MVSPFSTPEQQQIDASLQTVKVIYLRAFLQVMAAILTILLGGFSLLSGLFSLALACVSLCVWSVGVISYWLQLVKQSIEAQIQQIGK